MQEKAQREPDAVTKATGTREHTLLVEELGLASDLCSATGVVEWAQLIDARQMLWWPRVDVPEALVREPPSDRFHHFARVAVASQK